MPVVDVALKGDRDAVPLGEPADHEQAHPAGGVGCDVGAVAQGLVDVGECHVGDPEAGVLDLDASRRSGLVVELISTVVVGASTPARCRPAR